MSQSNGQPDDIVELASLPATNPRRAQHSAGLTGSAREEFERETMLTDHLRAALEEVAVPSGLEARLLARAHPPGAAPGDATAPPSARESATAMTAPPVRRVGFLQRPIDGRLAAIVVFLVGIAAVYFLLLRQPSKPMPLDSALADTLASLAVRNGDAPAEITSSDPGAVSQKLSAQGLDFPVLMLQPTAGTLEGGGVCDFGGTRAAFTKWNVNGQTYTLFQFNGKKLHVPGQFIAVTRLPDNPAKTGAHQQVFVFPGTQGKCCWALVMAGETSPNVFAQYGANY